MKIKLSWILAILIGGGTGIIFKRWEAGVTAAVLVLILFRGSRSLKRSEKSFERFPQDWKEFLYQHSLYYPHLKRRARRRFETNIRIFLSDLRIEGKYGAHTELEIRLLIASGLATFLIGRPEWELPLPKKVVVIPGARLEEDLGVGNGEYAACATRETLYLTEKNLEISFKDSRDRYNNIFHEIAHYFDSEDDTIDGKPFFYKRIKNNKTLEFFYFHWKRVLSDEFERAKKGELQIRPYALKSIGEFFACAVEYFFEDPKTLKQESKKLYVLLVKFFKFDPLKLLETPKNKI